MVVLNESLQMYLLALKRNFQVTWEYTVESAVNVVYAVRALTWAGAGEGVGRGGKKTQAGPETLVHSKAASVGCPS